MPYLKCQNAYGRWWLGTPQLDSARLKSQMQASSPYLIKNQVLKVQQQKGVSLQLNKQLQKQLYTYTYHIRAD